MKKLYLTAISILICAMAYSQETKKFSPKTQHRCHFDERMEMLKQSDPEFAEKINRVNSTMAARKQDRMFQRSIPAGSTINIPVVVRIIHNGGPENIPDNQVISQISALNEYFDDYGIQFCLATLNNAGAALGGTTPGILRTPNAALTNFNISTEEGALNALLPLLPSQMKTRKKRKKK